MSISFNMIRYMFYILIEFINFLLYIIHLKQIYDTFHEMTSVYRVRWMYIEKKKN